jgi:hypothetical protein
MHKSNREKVEEEQRKSIEKQSISQKAKVEEIKSTYEAMDSLTVKNAAKMKKKIRQSLDDSINSTK